MKSTVSHDHVGLALAGGGPEGAIYEIGVLRALEVAIEGLELNRVPNYVGISSGAFLAASLANQITPSQLVRAIIKTDPGEHPFQPELFLTPAFGEFLRSGIALPKLFAEALGDFLTNRKDKGIIKSFSRISRAIPVGLFNNNPLRKYLEQVFSKPGRTTDFRELKSNLHIVAADLDTGQKVVFGEPGMDHISIPLAVQASTALPGLYPPVLIEGRHYVDGVLLKTLHASSILNSGVDLAICINPIVPVDTGGSVEAGYMRRGKLIDRGMPAILSQTLRTLIHSRMEIGFRRYGLRYQNTDILLVEPERNDYRMFFTNTFSFASRKTVCEHAFRATLKQLSQRRETLGPMLKKHGFQLNLEALDCYETLDLWKGVGLDLEPKKTIPTKDVHHALAKLEHLIEMRTQKAASDSQNDMTRALANVDV